MNSNFILALLQSALALGKPEAIKLLGKWYDGNPKLLGPVLVFSDVLIDQYLVPAVAKSETKIDDNFVGNIKEIVNTVAQEKGITLAVLPQLPAPPAA